MTTCKMCGAPVLGRQVTYCSKACRRAGHAARGRERYATEPAFAEQAKARANAWNAGCIARGVSRWQREKAARFAAVLGRVKS